MKLNSRLVCVALAAASILTSSVLSGQTVPQGGVAAPGASAAADRVAYDGGVIPEGYHLDSESDHKTMMLGGGLLVVGVLTLVVGASQYEDPSNCSKPELCDSHNQDLLLPTLVGGGLTIVGLTTAMIGFASRREVLVRDKTTTAGLGARPVISSIGPQGTMVGIHIGGAF